MTGDDFPSPLEGGFKIEVNRHFDAFQVRVLWWYSSDYIGPVIKLHSQDQARRMETPSVLFGYFRGGIGSVLANLNLSHVPLTAGQILNSLTAGLINTFRLLRKRIMRDRLFVPPNKYKYT